MAPVELLYSCWLPDRGEPFKWFERGFGGVDFFTKGFATGTLYLYVRNTGNRPIRPEAFLLNDTPLEKLREERKAHWWRLLPALLPPDAVGEIGIRLARTPDTALSIRVTLDNGSQVSVQVPIQNPSIRIETIGFNERSDTVTLTVENVDGRRRRVTRVWLDLQEVTRQCRLLDPDFRTGIALLVLRLKRPLTYGSYHVYRVQTSDGATAACCVRTGDDWVPLGSYGYTTYVDFARNGCNGHNSFSRLSREQLDLHARLAMKAVMIIGDSPPADYMKGHPGLFAYSPLDEPDVGDYFEAKNLPDVQRIGYLAMEMERRCQTYREADPGKMNLLTVNLTYKPMNYYIYAPVADIVNPDCYPLSLGADVKMVYEVVRTVRCAAGPRPVTFTFQSCYEEPYNPTERAKMRFPRPPTPGEIRLMTLYAIAAGARGLFGYGHHTERTSRYLHRGSGEFPEVWRAIGEVYREIEHVAPVLAKAHPTAIARADLPTVLVSTLVAGEDALLLAVVNEDYVQERHRLRVNPATVQIKVPELPWLTPRFAWLVKHTGFERLPLKTTAAGATITLSGLETAGLVLVAQAESVAHTLRRRYEQRVARVTDALRQLQE